LIQSPITKANCKSVRIYITNKEEEEETGLDIYSCPRLHLLAINKKVKKQSIKSLGNVT
jgi:hypothetical protein